MSATQIKNVRAWHEELLEFILANPRASLQEASLYFNVSISWISIVKNSDAFKEMWAQRREAHFSRVSAGITERVTALADVAVDALTNKLEADSAKGEASLNSLKEVSEMALRSLGFGNKGVPSVQINAPSQTNVFIDKETLARAREAKNQVAEKFEPKIIENNMTAAEKEMEIVKLEREF